MLHRDRAAVSELGERALERLEHGHQRRREHRRWLGVVVAVVGGEVGADDRTQARERAIEGVLSQQAALGDEPQPAVVVAERAQADLAADHCGFLARSLLAQILGRDRLADHVVAVAKLGQVPPCHEHQALLLARGLAPQRAGVVVHLRAKQLIEQLRDRAWGSEQHEGHVDRRERKVLAGVADRLVGLDQRAGADRRGADHRPQRDLGDGSEHRVLGERAPELVGRPLVQPRAQGLVSPLGRGPGHAPLGEAQDHLILGKDDRVDDREVARVMEQLGLRHVLAKARAVDDRVEARDRAKVDRPALHEHAVGQQRGAGLVERVLAGVGEQPQRRAADRDALVDDVDLCPRLARELHGARDLLAVDEHGDPRPTTALAQQRDLGQGVAQAAKELDDQPGPEPIFDVNPVTGGLPGHARDFVGLIGAQLERGPGAVGRHAHDSRKLWVERHRRVEGERELL
ncbi:hypothetical protein DB30_00978 [Enhygromyxa salina]|uniref:Uncharacterized protein n=1 Tax=Enhygromyxa salina TaxID=215803 RepID=A0A0C2CT82_9BACT|nr:hypothetical protein DB30_00978 [Enhygromyxa salina]